MGLTSFFRSKAAPAAKAASAAESSDAVDQARTRARRRLIGALVLVVIGVIGFPLLFETQPRPIPVDIPIEIPKKEGAAPLSMPAARARSAAAAPAEPLAPPPSEIITESRADAGRDIPSPVAPASAPATAATHNTPRDSTAANSAKASNPNPNPTPPATATPKPQAPAAATDARRAQALLEGRDAASKASASKEDARYVVQVGAFADSSAAARETRAKIEKLGLKTYTQVAETSSGSRIRVRVGPFKSRDEADRALAKARAAGVAAVVLTL